MVVMDTFFILLFSAVIVIAILWIVAAVLRKKNEAEIKSHPVLTKTAKLIDMQQVPAGQIVLGEIWVLFELQDGERLRLNANPQNNLMIGDVGILTWQGRRILSFKRNRNIQ